MSARMVYELAHPPASRTRAPFMKAAYPLLRALLVILIAPPAWAQSSAVTPSPNWSLELKLGRFQPDVPDWETYYGSDTTRAFALALGRKLLRTFEVGAEVAYGSTRGEGDLPLNSGRGGDVLYEFAPVNAYVIARGVLSERQWLVPFVGAGLGKLYYRQHVTGGPSNEGSTPYYVARAGVQLLLDPLSPRGALNLRRGYSIEHTYFVIDYQRSRAEVDGTSWDLGGTTWLAGLLFEY